MEKGSQCILIVDTASKKTNIGTDKIEKISKDIEKKISEEVNNFLTISEENISGV